MALPMQLSPPVISAALPSRAAESVVGLLAVFGPVAHRIFSARRGLAGSSTQEPLLPDLNGWPRSWMGLEKVWLPASTW